jgi:hypothetical protein
LCEMLNRRCLHEYGECAYVYLKVRVVYTMFFF